MQFRILGHTGIRLPAMGLGCMGMSHAYEGRDDEESLATLERAIELGVTFWDTADFYGNGENERLLARVLRHRRQELFIATKFGFKPTPENPFSVDASPAYMRTAVEASLRRLGIDTIDLYYAHRVDPQVPVEETVGAMSELVKEGKVRYLGLSEASADALSRAHAVHPIAALQSEYSLLTREVEKEILPLCRKLGIAFIPFSPLSRGLLTRTVDGAGLGDKDFRKTLPRFSGPHWENNRQLADAFSDLAFAKHCTPAQLGLAWVLAQGDIIIPIPGTRRRKHLQENVAALDVTLTAEDFSAIEAVLARFPDIGPRYAGAMARLVAK